MSATHRCLLRPALLGCLALLSACGGGGGPVDDEEGKDTTPPAAVGDLAVTGFTSASVTLQWTAPGDLRDDGSGGAIAAYDLRRAGAEITATSFVQALPVASPPAPLPAGQMQQLPVTGLAPGATYYFALRSGDDKGNWSAVSNCVQAYCPAVEPIEFPDPALEQAIREHVHKPSGDLFSSDVDTIVHFAAREAGIVSLVGMQFCLSLRTAQLSDNAIVELWPLMNLTGLRGLFLRSNQVSNLSPLVSLVDLTQLDLIWNPVVSLLPVGYLRSLRQLGLSGTGIPDYSPLFGLEQLDELYLGGMNLTDVGFLANLHHLRHLSLEINTISSLEPLRGLTGLEALSLMQNVVTDVGPLAGLVALRDLNLAKNRIEDIQGLVDNPGLDAGDQVDLRENPLSAQALIAQVPALEARGVVVLR